MTAFKCCLLLLFFPALAFAQTEGPNQKLATLTKNFIALYNTGDTAQYRSFIAAADAEHAAPFLQQMGQEMGMLGPVTPEAVNIISPTETQTLMQSAHFEAWWQLIVLTDSAQRYKEHHMRLVRVTDAVLQPKMATNIEVGAAIEAFIKRQEKWEPFNGNVLILKDGKPVYARTFGTAANGQPHQMKDTMGLASVGKMFTAVAVLQLADAGKLKLTDTISHLLPELKNPALARITVQQLLSHTSGMGDFFEDPQYGHVLDSAKAAFSKQGRKATDAALHVAYYESDGLRFAPGTDWAYSNTGFELLGYLIERLSKRPYPAYVQQHILKPAGMTGTEAGSGAGGGRATAGDLVRFSTALQSAKLLSKSRTAEYLRYSVNDHYGWGLERQTLGGETIVGHSGGFENICNEVNLYTKSGYTVVILSNSNPPFGHFLSDKIKTLLVPKTL